MNYPLREDNVLCRIFGHGKRSYVDRDGISRVTCSLCGHTEPPFRQLSQVPPHDYLPDDQQPEGAR